MSIKYEISTIRNSGGTTAERRFVRIRENEPMTAEQLESQIQASCSLTRGDVRAALSALVECMADELSSGRRFMLPGIGYFSLSAGIDAPGSVPDAKVRGGDISVRRINYRPSKALLDSVRQRVAFERAQYSSQSRRYGEDELAGRVRAYLSANSCLTRRDMQREFGLRKSQALRWLKRFVDAGLLRRDGVRSAPVYMLA